MKALDNRFYVKFMRLEIGLFKCFQIKYVKNRSIRLKILTYESPMQSETLGAD